MPVIKRRDETRASNHDELVAELVPHLRGDSDLPEQPLIVEEDVRLSNTMRVYVVWDAWRGIEEEERTEIILEAYQQARGKEEMLRITIAMGVEPWEAKRLGLPF